MENDFKKNALSFLIIAFFMAYFITLIILTTLYYGDLSPGTMSGSSQTNDCDDYVYN